MKAFIAVLLFFSSVGYAQIPSEKQLGPWLDLWGGGIATGAAQGKDATQGGLINATLLPPRGPYFRRIGRDTDAYGTGMMISLLRNAAWYYGTFLWPGYVLSIGGIAQQNGGPFAPHSSHQNGLDADIPYIGTSSYESVVGGDGKVTDRFLYAQNWEFWRLLYRQRILRNNVPMSVVSMILVDPAIKDALCVWAQQNKMLDIPENAEIMRRVRPTAGHDDHFHLRLHCSPHHPQCIDGGASRTLCP